MTSKDKTEEIEIELDKEDYNIIKQKAKDHGVTVNELINIILEHELKTVEHELNDGVPAEDVIKALRKRASED